MKVREDLRNIAIIAHVDHGKTTLVDQLLHQSGIFRSNETVQERAMDSNDLERERGITILAKNTAVRYKDTMINILDTPGHADFGGEVERIMRLVDGVVLIVDAYEGTMPQTRFVLKKAFENKLRPIVVVNKIDRDFARPKEVVDEVLDLFIELGADEEQLEFPVVYASALKGTSSLDPNQQEENMESLFKMIVEYIPAPIDNADEPLQFQTALLDYNDYLGRIGIGRVFRGMMRVGDQVVALNADGSTTPFRITKLHGFMGLKRIEIQEAKAGDLVAISGMDNIQVGQTISSPEVQEALPYLKIEEPTLQMTFSVNNSPFAGRDGKWITARKIEERLMKQLQTDVSLRVEETDSPDAWIVSGRGELHLSILIENMRREGFELQVSKPEVIIKMIDGQAYEPYETVQLDVPSESMGAVIESLGIRKGEMQEMQDEGTGTIRLIYFIPARGLIGYTTEFMTLTKGLGMINHSFEEFRPYVGGQIGGRREGVLVSIENGQATAYSIGALEDRGVIFIEPGTEVYEGMIIGEHTRENDLGVNVVKAKAQTNIRSATKDNTVTLKRPRQMSLEQSLEYLNDDELCEITPNFVRIRKKILNKAEREKMAKRKKYEKEIH
ncbi:MAG TPA: translational GTPase TypA [Firmicutes bacterium]|nr:translational GTPase TypA [Bacillales bacterium]HJA40474.1 translational GTPase TypA [Bacillota bacterium]